MSELARCHVADCSHWAYKFLLVTDHGHRAVYGLCRRHIELDSDKLLALLTA